MKLDETENLKLKFVSNMQTTTSHIINIQDLSTELAEKITPTQYKWKESNLTKIFIQKIVQLIENIQTQHRRMPTKTTR